LKQKRNGYWGKGPPIFFCGTVRIIIKVSTEGAKRGCGAITFLVENDCDFLDSRTRNKGPGRRHQPVRTGKLLAGKRSDAETQRGLGPMMKKFAGAGLIKGNGECSSPRGEVKGGYRRSLVLKEEGSRRRSEECRVWDELAEYQGIKGGTRRGRSGGA